MYLYRGSMLEIKRKGHLTLDFKRNFSMLEKGRQVTPLFSQWVKGTTRPWPQSCLIMTRRGVKGHSLA